LHNAFKIRRDPLQQAHLVPNLSGIKVRRATPECSPSGTWSSTIAIARKELPTSKRIEIDRGSRVVTTLTVRVWSRPRTLAPPDLSLTNTGNAEIDGTRHREWR
jgi:hypothetical protein